MPPVLTKAHAALDSAVDKLIVKQPSPMMPPVWLSEPYGKKTEGLLTGKRRKKESENKC